MKDKVIEIMLRLFDAVLDCVTFGAWSQISGDVLVDARVKGDE